MQLQIKRSWVVTNYNRPAFADVVKLRFVRYALTARGNPIYRIGEVKGKLWLLNQ